MGKLFGTDGVRDIANEYPTTSEMALNIGSTMTYLFKRTRHSLRLIITPTNGSNDEGTEAPIGTGQVYDGVPSKTDQYRCERKAGIKQKVLEFTVGSC
ncbi:MAG: hypothetical protein JXC33_01855 [Deltaproteobacteria bacterium]|nr:hypothetical protein [Deltaproteobacteria bacterium]